MFSNNNDNCKCCFWKALIDAIKNIKCNCEVPQPLEIKTDPSNPLDINCGVTVPQPLEVSGNIAISDACTQDLVNILSNTSTYNKIVLKTGDEFQNVTDVTVTGTVLKFTNQSQTVIAPVCSVEYVVAG